ncbi:MAG: FhaA domain-containing protein [Anaerolineales bacterium]
MSTLEDKLARLESRLQNIFEGSAERLFPTTKPPKKLAHSLIEAMKDGIQPGAKDGLFAPNQFVVHVDPEQAERWQTNPDFLGKLTTMLGETAAEEGIRFTSTPIIRIQPNPRFTAGEIRVNVQSKEIELPQTAAMEIISDEDFEGIAQDAFLIVDGVDIFPLTQPVVNIGRRTDNQLVINEQKVSRVHAQLRVIKGSYVIFDLDSSGGTFVNGARIHQITLNPGDVISIAGVPVVFGQESAGQNTTQDININYTANQK